MNIIKLYFIMSDVLFLYIVIYTIDIKLSILYFQWPEIINSDGLTLNALYISLPYFWYSETYSLTQKNGFLDQLSACKMPNFDAVHKQRIGKG